MKGEVKRPRKNGYPKTYGGVVPSLCMKGSLGPPRNECGIGALAPFADKLWAVTYASHTETTDKGGGLYEIDAELNMIRRPESRAGTYTNRFVHYQTTQLLIGPHVIDASGKVRTAEELVNVRICATMAHRDDPDQKVYMLGMEGEFFEMDVKTLRVRRLFDLCKELSIKTPHFKAGVTSQGRVVVACNTYHFEDGRGCAPDGRLAEWEGGAWRIIRRTAFAEAAGPTGGATGDAVFATGWDRASAILMVMPHKTGVWREYRLPKASHTFDHYFLTEWPRIRQTEHLRTLMDCHGQFYELMPWIVDGSSVWGVRPISTHLWVLGDFCSYRGMLVMGNDSASPKSFSDPTVGEPQSGMWVGKTDDLWNFGPVGGWGGPWWETPVRGGEPSVPYLMTGFDKKVLHLRHDSDSEVAFKVEIDFQGNDAWCEYDTIRVGPRGYAHHEFPSGFSAHWVRVTPLADCVATAQFMYT